MQFRFASPAPIYVGRQSRNEEQDKNGMRNRIRTIGTYRFNADIVTSFQLRGSRETIGRFLCTTHYDLRHGSLRPLAQFSLPLLTIQFLSND